jgi:hypothetical protein
VLTLTGFCSALTFQTRDIAGSGGLSYQKTLPLSKGFWLDGFLGVEPRSVGVALAEGLWDLAGGGGGG